MMMGMMTMMKMMTIKMEKEEVFELWGRVLLKDKEAKKMFVSYYLEMYPEKEFLTKELSEVNLRIMYNHLYYKLK